MTAVGTEPSGGPAVNTLRLHGLTVRYGRAVAVAGVDIVAPPGKITAVVGANGAGKSSLLLAAYGSVRHGGTVHLGDDELTGSSAVQRLRSGVAIVPQGRQLFPRLSVRENLQVAAERLRLPRAAVTEAEQRFPVLAERYTRRAGVLSGGEQQMLAVTRALMGSPRALLLDEIVTGLAPKIVQELIATTRALAAGGIAVLLASPELAAMRGAVDRGYVMVRGEIVAQTEEGGAVLEQQYERAMSSVAAVVRA